VKNIRKAHLTQYVKNNTHAKLCIKMCAALALLPAALIEEGFQTVKQHARDNNIHIDVFFNYFSRFEFKFKNLSEFSIALNSFYATSYKMLNTFYRYWLRSRGPEVFSVHGLPIRTNNNIESFHNDLKEKFNVIHPNLFRFLGK